MRENGDGNKEGHSSHGEEFRPDFTHQLFEEERIEGFEEGELTIRVLYSPTSLDFLVKTQTGDTDDTRCVTAVIFRTWQLWLPCDVCRGFCFGGHASSSSRISGGCLDCG